MSSVSPSPSKDSLSSAAKSDPTSALQKALGSLNVSLESELARYRYAKRGRTTPMPAALQGGQRLRPAQGLQGQPVSVMDAKKVVMPPLPPNPRLQKEDLAETVATGPAETSEEVPSAVAALRRAIVHQPADNQETDALAAAAIVGDSVADAASHPFPEMTPAASSRWQERFTTPLGLGSLLLLLVASAGLGFVLVNPSMVQHLRAKVPFLRSHKAVVPATETAGADTADVSGDAATPSSLGPDLSQNEFTGLTLNRLSTLPADSSQDTAASRANLSAADPAPAATRGEDKAASPPAAVNSAARKPTGEAAPPVAAAASPAPSPPTPVAPTPAATVTALPPVADPVITPQSAAPEPQQIVPSATSPADDKGATPLPQEPDVDAAQPSTVAYYVVSDYTGDPSLLAARDVVADAYVRNFDAGARIQLGAFGTEAAAATLAETLKSQGIEAQVYTP